MSLCVCGQGGRRALMPFSSAARFSRQCIVSARPDRIATIDPSVLSVGSRTFGKLNLSWTISARRAWERASGIAVSRELEKTKAEQSARWKTA